jgi:hypothetical protein
MNNDEDGFVQLFFTSKYKSVDMNWFHNKW